MSATNPRTEYFLSKILYFRCSPEYDRLLFTMVDRLQKLNLDENERNLLKLVGFFETGKFSVDRHLLLFTQGCP